MWKGWGCLHCLWGGNSIVKRSWSTCLTSLDDQCTWSTTGFRFQLAQFNLVFCRQAVCLVHCYSVAFINWSLETFSSSLPHPLSKWSAELQNGSTAVQWEFRPFSLNFHFLKHVASYLTVVKLLNGYLVWPLRKQLRCLACYAWRKFKKVGNCFCRSISHSWKTGANDTIIHILAFYAEVEFIKHLFLFYYPCMCLLFK